MAMASTGEKVAFPFDGESDIDELDVIGPFSPTRSTTVVGDATPPDHTARQVKLDTLIIPARKSKRSRTPSLVEKDDPHAGIQKKQKMENKKAVSPFLPRNVRLYAGN
jgi:SWI/SNF-related matrix-associated actin-dependent regulator of chromatin subfamily A member 5